jgi:ADP-ribose pyrophosphatase
VGKVDHRNGESTICAVYTPFSHDLPVSDKVVFSVPWFDILARTVEFSASPYYFLRTSDYVSVLAATTEGSFLLVRQYRPVVGADTLELPSGHVEDGELPEAAARRELAEETGYEAEIFEPLGTLDPDTGRLGNKLWCFYAGRATQVQSPVNREGGVELVQCGASDLIRHVRDGKVTHGLHLAVLLLAVMRGWLPAGQESAQPK